MNLSRVPASKLGMKRLALLLATLLVIGSATVAFALSTGERAPELNARDLNGQQVQLSDLRGKVVLVDFWATWCSPCRDELPHLQRLYRELGPQGFVVVGVSVDRDDDEVRPFVRRLGITFPVIHDGDHLVTERYRPTTMPTSFLIDRDGKIRRVNVGFRNADVPELERQIREALGPATPPAAD